MIDNAVIQADVVASLKANATLIPRLVREDGEGGAENVKESQWAGTDFIYPAVRVRINRQVPITSRQNCDHANLTFSIRVLTEDGSSKDADEIAGIVADQFHGNAGGGKFYRGTGWSTYLRSTGLVSALRLTERIWMAEVLFGGVVYPS